MPSWLIIAGVCILVVSILSFLFKSVVKVIIASCLITLLFKIGFIWNADEIINNLRLNQFLKPEYQEKIETGLEGFVEKRNNNEIIDANEIEKAVKEAVTTTTKNAIEKLSEIEKEELLDDLFNKLEDLDMETVDAQVKELIEKIQKEGKAND